MKRLLPELAHHVISLLRSNRVAFRVKRTSTSGRPRLRTYEYAVLARTGNDPTEILGRRPVELDPYRRRIGPGRQNHRAQQRVAGRGCGHDLVGRVPIAAVCGDSQELLQRYVRRRQGVTGRGCAQAWQSNNLREVRGSE